MSSKKFSKRTSQSGISRRITFDPLRKKMEKYSEHDLIIPISQLKILIPKLKVKRIGSVKVTRTVPDPSSGYSGGSKEVHNYEGKYEISYGLNKIIWGGDKTSPAHVKAFKKWISEGKDISPFSFEEWRTILEKQRKDLDRRFELGLIPEEAYDREVEQLNSAYNEIFKRIERSSKEKRRRNRNIK